MRRFFCTVILLILIACPVIAVHPALAQIYSETDVAGDADSVPGAARRSPTSRMPFPDEIHIHLGAMDRPEDFPPHGKPAFPEDRLPWLRVAGVD